MGAFELFVLFEKANTNESGPATTVRTKIDMTANGFPLAVDARGIPTKLAVDMRTTITTTVTQFVGTEAIFSIEMALTKPKFVIVEVAAAREKRDLHQRIAEWRGKRSKTPWWNDLVDTPDEGEALEEIMNAFDKELSYSDTAEAGDDPWAVDSAEADAIERRLKQGGLDVWSVEAFDHYSASKRFSGLV